MIGFVDAPPSIEPKAGHFLVTFNSGGEEVKLLLTRHALFATGRDALNIGHRAFAGDAEVIPLKPGRASK